MSGGFITGPLSDFFSNIHSNIQDLKIADVSISKNVLLANVKLSLLTLNSDWIR